MKLLMLILIFMVLEIPAHKLTGRLIMEQVDDKLDGEDRKMSLKMVLVNRRGRRRERSMVVYSRDFGKDSKSIFAFKTPADVKGVSFLTWNYDNPNKDDDRWLYLPALRRSKRISGKAKNDYFMGSDLTYDDMGDRSVDEDKHKLVREEASHWVIESVPVSTDDMYSRVVKWVQKKSLIASKVEFYDRQGLLLKVMEKKGIVQKQGYWIAMETKVHNVQDNHKTFLNIQSIKYDQGLKKSLFRVSTLEQERVR